MKKNIMVLTLIMLSTTSYAKDYLFDCTAKHNLEVVLDSQIVLKANEKEKTIGEVDGFRFFLSSKGNEIFELQAADMFEPSRHYANAKLSEGGSFIELSIWKREYLMEISCLLR